MKNLLFIAAIVLLASCNTAEPESAKEVATAESEAIGFNTMLPDLKWHLGTEAAIQIVKDLDVKWAAKDYEAIRGFFADTAECYFEDGRVAKSADEFIAILKAGNEESDFSWTFDYAYSVDLDPTRGGEHVQAGFTGTEVTNGVEKKDHIHESYYVVDGKIVMWRQFKMEVTGEE